MLRLPEGGRFVVEIEMVDGTMFPYTGRITFADPSFNSQTGTFLLRATVDNPHGLLRPNQYVRARLSGAIRPNAIVVPQRAVQQGAKGHFVWVINKENQAELRPVVVGDWYRGDGWFVTEGLAAGDQVVVDGGVRLAQGAAVTSTPYVRRRRAAAGAYRGAGGAARTRCEGRTRDPAGGRRADSRRASATLDADARQGGAPGLGGGDGHRHHDHHHRLRRSRAASAPPTSRSRSGAPRPYATR